MTKEQKKETRAKLGLTQAQFAEKIGCSTATVKAWEGGRQEPNRQAQKIITMLVAAKIVENYKP